MFSKCLLNGEFANNKRIVNCWADRSSSMGVRRVGRERFTYPPVLADS